MTADQTAKARDLLKELRMCCNVIDGPVMVNPEEFKLLEAALSQQPEGEPFGFFYTDDPEYFAMPGGGFKMGSEPPEHALNVIPAYTHPAAQPAVPDVSDAMVDAALRARAPGLPRGYVWPPGKMSDMRAALKAALLAARPEVKS